MKDALIGKLPPEITLTPVLIPQSRFIHPPLMMFWRGKLKINNYPSISREQQTQSWYEKLKRNCWQRSWPSYPHWLEKHGISISCCQPLPSSVIPFFHSLLLFPLPSLPFAMHLLHPTFSSLIPPKCFHPIHSSVVSLCVFILLTSQVSLCNAPFNPVLSLKCLIKGLAVVWSFI